MQTLIDSEFWIVNITLVGLSQLGWEAEMGKITHSNPLDTHLGKHNASKWENWIQFATIPFTSPCKFLSEMMRGFPTQMPPLFRLVGVTWWHARSRIKTGFLQQPLFLGCDSCYRNAQVRYSCEHTEKCIRPELHYKLWASVKIKSPKRK